MKNTNTRWVFLVICSLLTTGRYYCYDNPQALEVNIEDNLNIGESTYNLLYGVYSLPNIVLPFVGGILVDSMGVKFAILLFTFLGIVGQGIFMCGGYMNNFGLMVAGRGVFGLQGECVCVIQSAIIAKWFKRKELAFAMMIASFSQRLSSSLNSFITPKLYTYSNNLGFPLLIGLCFCGLSFACALLVCYCESKEYKTMILLRSQASTLQPELELDEPKIKLKDICSFKIWFWIFLMNGVAFNISVFTFLTIANKFYVSRFGYSNVSAGNMLTIFYLLTGILTPISGKLVDIYGKRFQFIVISMLVLVGAMAMLTFLPNYQAPNIISVIPLILLGGVVAAYSAAFYPSVAFLVEPRKFGISYGLMLATINASLAASPELVGLIHDNTTYIDFGYFWVSIALGAVAILGIFIAIFVFKVYAKQFHVLNLNRKRRNST
jgi:MFS family permease